VEELHEIVDTVGEVGEFAFDVETRGNISRHPEVVALFDQEWEAKKATLKSTHPSVVERSKQAITEKWIKDIALDPLRNDVFWLSIATEGRSWAIPMGHPNGEVLVPEIRWKNAIAPEGHRVILPSGKESMARSSGLVPATFTAPPEQLAQEQVFGVLEPIFMDPDIPKINQNIKFDCKSVAKYYGGELPRGRYIDTMVLTHLLNENLSSYNLSGIIDYHFGWDPYWRDGKVGGSVTTEPFSVVCRYAHYDARWAYMVYQRAWRRLQNYGLMPATYREIDVTRVIAQMEMNGVLIDQRAMKRLGEQLQSDLNAALMEISMAAPVGFNPNSDDDKRAFFFGKKRDGGLGLKSTKKTPSGNKLSVDADVLKGLKGKHPLVDTFLEYNEIEKLKSTFVDNMPPMLHHGRLHPQFHLHRTATGRLSSSGPNLQNIPTDARVRSLFTAEPGNSLVVADYGQIEMRVFAMFSQDEKLKYIFSNNIDIHTGTASVIYGISPEEVTHEQRQIGKIANFLMGYGGTAKRLFHSAGGALTMEQAEEVVVGYDKGYAGMTAWKAEALDKARVLGYVETRGGRRRRLQGELESNDFWTRIRAERQAINAIIQGTAAEICKDAMIKLDAAFEYPKCRILVQVHDEMVSSVPTDELSTWVPVIEESMGNGTLIEGIELSVEAHYAGNWADAKG
jgi:DNA polymerase I-like protein with 3'-5' exonuclease and polymerase domains